jgi:hypothetical protein
MDEAKCTEVVARLRARGAFAHVHPVGVYEYGVRIVLPFPDDREAIWDADGAAGLEAVVMRDGVLVGLVETVPGSENLDIDGVVSVIATADYDAPLSTKPRPPRPAAAGSDSSARAAPRADAARPSGWRRLFRR